MCRRSPERAAPHRWLREVQPSAARPERQQALSPAVGASAQAAQRVHSDTRERAVAPAQRVPPARVRGPVAAAGPQAKPERAASEAQEARTLAQEARTLARGARTPERAARQAAAETAVSV